MFREILFNDYSKYWLIYYIFILKKQTDYLISKYITNICYNDIISYRDNKWENIIFIDVWNYKMRQDLQSCKHYFILNSSCKKR